MTRLILRIDLNVGEYDELMVTRAEADEFVGKWLVATDLTDADPDSMQEVALTALGSINLRIELPKLAPFAPVAGMSQAANEARQRDHDRQLRMHQPTFYSQRVANIRGVTVLELPA